jgi:predicted metallopeptidase
MPIRYAKDEKIQHEVEFIVRKLGFRWVDVSRVVCVRSFGSGSRRTLARCYTMPKIMQVALGMKAYYIIEVISERFDKLSQEDKTKTLIHELMHIPGTMGGGFRHHGDHVTSKNVDEMYRKLVTNVWSDFYMSNKDKKSDYVEVKG